MSCTISRSLSGYHACFLSFTIAALACFASASAGASDLALFGVDTATNQLLRIDPATGAGTAVGPLGNGGIAGLTFDPTTNTLFGTSGRLLSIDTLTGAATPIGGPLGFSVPGVAAHPITGELFGVDSIADVLVRIDKDTGVATLVGPLGGGPAFANVTGLAFDPTGRTLFGVENGNDQLVTIDTSTGAATGVGDPFTVGGLVVTALAFDPVSGRLFGSDTAGRGDGQLVEINPVTGVGTPIGAVGFDIVEGLAFAPVIPEPATGLTALLIFATALLRRHSRF